MRKSEVSDDRIEKTLETFKALTPIFSVLSDENRQLIISALGRYDQLNVTQLNDIVPLSRPAISHHLKLLKQSGLINVKKKGTENFYYLTLKRTIEDMEALMKEITSSCHIL